MQTIKEIKSGASKPYMKMMVRGEVIGATKPRTYTNKDGQGAQMGTVYLADATGHVKCTVFDSDLSKLTAGKTVIVKNFQNKTTHIIINAKSTLYSTPQRLSIPQEIKDAALAEFQPPAAPTLTIRQAKLSPVKMLTSIKGYIRRDDDKKTVLTKSSNRPTTMRSLTMDDGTDTIRVSLWRDSAEANVAVGDYISITNLAVGAFNDQAQLSSTTSSTVKIAEVTTTERELIPIGVTKEDEGFSIMFLDGENIVDYSFKNNEAIIWSNSPEEKLESCIMKGEPVIVKLKGKEILKISENVEVDEELLLN